MKIRRIVVGLDTAPHSRSALAAAACLADELDADLEALFVESEELHRLAGLPFARELGHSTASVRRFDPASLERSLQAHADEARRALTALAVPRALRWSLRVTRGSVTEEVLAASTGADLTVLGVARWGPEEMRFAQEAPATLVVLTREGARHGPLVAIVPITIAPGQAVTLVRSLANAIGDGLTVLAVGADLETAGAWCAQAAELLERQGRKASLEIVREGQPEALQAALDRLAPRAVAIVTPAPTPES